MTYKIASDLAQRRARQLWLADLQGPGFQALTLEERRDSLKAKLRAIDAEIVCTPKGIHRDELGVIKHDIQEQMHALRPKLRTNQSLPNHFIEVAKERLTKFQYRQIMEEASKRALNQQELADGTGK